MSNFTCITCRVAFVDADLQRNHYKTDWHRYNLKRKIAELPPVTADNFKERVLAQRATQAELEKDTSSYCQLCSKHFNTRNAFDNHIQSKKHLDMQIKREEEAKAQVQKRNEKNEHKGLDVIEENRKVAEKNLKNLALRDTMQGSQGPSTSGGATGKTKKTAPVEEPMEEEEVSEEEWDGEALGEEECLFCSKISNSLDANLQHMTKVHSFFIPDVEFLTDVPGLIQYLGEKVGEGYICLWCNEKGKAFYTVKSVQQHMVDKGHCNMFFDGDAVLEYSDFYDYRSSYPDIERAGAGDVEGAVGGEEGEDAVEETEVSPDLLNEDNYQLVLPSGSSIGHRSLQRYYRQKLKSGRERNLHAVSKVIAQYRALGWTGTKGPDSQRRAKDLAYVQRLKLRKNLRIGVRGNTVLTKHFRDQVFF